MNPENRLYKFLISGVVLSLAIVIGKCLWEILYLSIHQWNEPILFGDSWRFTERITGRTETQYLLSQHNEHRIVFAKAATIVETKILKIPPTQTALLQTLILLLTSCGMWAYLCKKMLKIKTLWLITFLAGSALILNPWQYENLAWEFQTPWIFINTLTLFAAIILTFDKKYLSPLTSSLQDVSVATIPWIAIFSTGQGIALGLALSICSWANSRRLGMISLLSFGCALFSTYFLLGYQKPSFHPEYQFNPIYFFRILTGGAWQGLLILIIVSILGIAFKFRGIRIQFRMIGSALMPSFFSIIFAGMTTLSRSGLGIEQANSPRYVSHSLMLGLSCILIAAICSDKGQINLKSLVLGPGVLTLIAFASLNTSNIIQEFNNQWTNARNFQGRNRSNFKCLGKKSSLIKMEIEHICPDGPHHKDIALEYFKGNTAIKPQGWHKKIIHK